MTMRVTMCEFVHGMKCEDVCDFLGKLVLCRDCIYYELDPDPIDPGWPMMCERTGQDMVEPYGYCAWGERKVDE